MAIGDERAAAAELVKGKRDRVPVAVVRGLPVSGRAGPPGGAIIEHDGAGVVPALVRDAAQDLFSLGTAEARAAGLREAARGAWPAGSTGSVDPAAVHRALTTLRVERVGDQLTSTFSAVGGQGVRCTAADPADPGSLVRLGADAHRLRAALAAEGIASTARFEPPGTVLLALAPA
jgi:coenzyme F420-0:L-glutamate ligase/coenzyme F420-1:gamma-L-glutamate ligase